MYSLTWGLFIAIDDSIMKMLGYVLVGIAVLKKEILTFIKWLVGLCIDYIILYESI